MGNLKLVLSNTIKIGDTKYIQCSDTTHAYTNILVQRYTKKDS